MKQKSHVVNNKHKRQVRLHPAVEILKDAADDQYAGYSFLLARQKANLHDSEWIRIDKEYHEVRSGNTTRNFKAFGHLDRRVRLFRMDRKIQAPGQTFYHGTSPAVAGQILARKGLLPGRCAGMFGSAVYIGRREKAEAYGGSWYTGPDNPVYRVLIRVAVEDFGRIINATEAKDYSDECDTAHGSPDFTQGIQREAEWAVYDPKRIKINGYEIWKGGA